MRGCHLGQELFVNATKTSLVLLEFEIHHQFLFTQIVDFRQKTNLTEDAMAISPNS
jgi:hypothetical protein